MLPTPPPRPERAPLPAPGPKPPLLAPGQQVLIYTPDGPLGGTFTCTLCRAQAWQPDLLQHAPGCPFVPDPARQ
jgi:hypothetical protein